MLISIGIIVVIVIIALLILFSFVPVGLWISAIAAGVKVGIGKKSITKKSYRAID